MTHQTTTRLPIFSVLVAAAVMLGCDDPPLEPNTSGEAPAIAENRAPGVVTEMRDVFGQGLDGEVVAEDGATIRRTPNGISVQLSMPTPEPGTYKYPTAGTAFSGPGHPEAFSLWVFVFDPDAEDVDGRPWTGAFAGGGHIVGGPNLTLSGHISTRTEPFLGNHLENPQEADVHLAVAPHGALDPDLLPEQIRTPTNPGPDIWWLAIFE